MSRSAPSARPTTRYRRSASRGAAGEPGEFLASDAVSLFLTRARAARPHLVADDAALEAAGRICAELDGLPLAIELAAARAKALSFPEIEARLADRFRFLVSWRRLTPARHQTLREAMDWSYQLLAPEEQSLLPRLAVFSGGFTLEAAAAVCLDGDAERALELVGRLVDASLVVPKQHDSVTRYRLLETVRQYARERIGDQSEEARTERRLAQYMLGLIERTQSAQQSALQEWVAELEPERGNLRAALTWSRDAGEPEWLLRLVERRLALLVGERRPRRRQHVARDGARAGSRGAIRRCVPRRSRGPPGSHGLRETSNVRANTRRPRCHSLPLPGIVAASRRR